MDLVLQEKEPAMNHGTGNMYRTEIFFFWQEQQSKNSRLCWYVTSMGPGYASLTGLVLNLASETWESWGDWGTPAGAVVFCCTGNLVVALWGFHSFP